MKQVIATSTRRVFDAAMGIHRKVVAGQPVPPELVDAYQQGGGETTEPGETRPAGAVIAAETTTVYDAGLGIRRRVVAGQPVPPELVDAYHAQTGDAPAPERDGDGNGGGQGDEPPSYDGLKKPELTDLVKERGIEDTVPGKGTVADLVAALERDDQLTAAKASYEGVDRAELDQKAAERELEVEGTGDDGAVTDEDLVAALAAHDVDSAGEVA